MVSGERVKKKLKNRSLEYQSWKIYFIPSSQTFMPKIHTQLPLKEVVFAINL